MSDSPFLLPRDKHEIVKIIRGLPNKFCSGFDKNSAATLKSVTEKIAKQFSSLVNIRLEQSPDLPKLAKLTPVFKKGSRTNINN